MEIVRSLILTREQLAEFLKDIADQLVKGKPVKSETLNAEVSSGEPIFVKLEYEDEYEKQGI